MNTEINDLAMLEIPAEMVDVSFSMNPVTDDLIRGDKLEEGMIVLLEDSMFRVPLKKPESELYDFEVVKRRQGQRWCRVTDLRNHHNLTSFVGLYADSTKEARTYNENYYWFVKKTI